MGMDVDEARSDRPSVEIELLSSGQVRDRAEGRLKLLGAGVGRWTEPIATMTPSSIATSQRRPALPVPSYTIAPRRIVSTSVVALQPIRASTSAARPATRSATEKLRKTDPYGASTRAANTCGSAPGKPSSARWT